MSRKIFGITGGTGCGKTTALNVLEDLGFYVIDCDALYYELLDTDQALLAAIEDKFPGVLKDGKLQRKVLGQRVFSNPEALDLLSHTAWPFVHRAVETLIREKAPQNIAIDAIGLIESGISDLCQLTIAVTAPEEARVRRLMAREGISEDYARLRIGAQKQNDVFAASCNVTIENSFDTAAQFQARCQEIFQTLIKEDASL